MSSEIENKNRHREIQKQTFLEYLFDPIALLLPVPYILKLASPREWRVSKTGCSSKDPRTLAYCCSRRLSGLILLYCFCFLLFCPTRGDLPPFFHLPLPRPMFFRSMRSMMSGISFALRIRTLGIHEKRPPLHSFRLQYSEAGNQRFGFDTWLCPQQTCNSYFILHERHW